MLEEEQKELPKGVFRDKLLIMCIPVTVPCINFTELMRATIHSQMFYNTSASRGPCFYPQRIMELIRMPQFSDFEGFHNAHSPLIVK